MNIALWYQRFLLGRRIAKALKKAPKERVAQLLKAFGDGHVTAAEWQEIGSDFGVLANKG